MRAFTGRSPACRRQASGAAAALRRSRSSPGARTSNACAPAATSSRQPATPAAEPYSSERTPARRGVRAGLEPRSITRLSEAAGPGAVRLVLSDSFYATYEMRAPRKRSRASDIAAQACDHAAARPPPGPQKPSALAAGAAAAHAAQIAGQAPQARHTGIVDAARRLACLGRQRARRRRGRAGARVQRPKPIPAQGDLPRAPAPQTCACTGKQQHMWCSYIT